ncbi:hypothetical protein ACQQ2N_01360 [Dokdonella sp. MW10]|uniref:hypothetical protein n=1 Tax=Dokdonella sp. MW10 TaxID=2992926 RepID=UPI003F80EF3E
MILATLAATLMSSPAMPSTELPQVFKRTRLTLFEGLVADPSPRRQVLVAGFYDHGEAPPSPRPADVVARAVAQLPDDAFVQWYAAYHGDYGTCFACRQLPTAAVTNLLRLEPDNAVGWIFSVALASARKDAEGIDLALSKLAGATHVDDHAMQAFTEWHTAFLSGLEEELLSIPIEEMPADVTAFSSAMSKVKFRASAAAAPIVAACRQTDARATSRRAPCAKAGLLLASKGNSPELRKLGLDVLEAVGERSSATRALQRQYDWLDAHDGRWDEDASDPVESTRHLLGAWDGAPNRIATIERRLSRLGKPLKPPSGWRRPVKESLERESSSPIPDGEHPWEKHAIAVGASLRTSKDPVDLAVAWALAERGASNDPATIANAGSIVDLARANADNIDVQWIAARHAGSRAGALANLQRLAPANIAVWLVALPGEDGDPELTTQLLAAAARGTHYTDPGVAMLGIVASKANTIRPAAGSVERMHGIMSHVSADTFGSVFTLISADALIARPWNFAPACRPDAPQIRQRRADCIAVARNLLHHGNTRTSVYAQSVLDPLSAETPVDLAKARERSWWLYVAADLRGSGSDVVVKDTATTGSEIEAARLAAERRGRLLPPKEWRTPWEDHRDEVRTP